MKPISRRSKASRTMLQKAIDNPALSRRGPTGEIRRQVGVFENRRRIHAQRISPRAAKFYEQVAQSGAKARSANGMEPRPRTGRAQFFRFPQAGRHRQR